MIGSRVVHDERVNSAVSPFDVASPGHYPVLDEECLDLALRAAHLLNCTISPSFNFDRKHYTYPDLPHGYQITQYHQPYATNGHVRLKDKNTVVPIERIQIEMDTGKSLGELIDMNRAGVGLLEIITPPVLRSATQSVEFTKTILETLRHGQICAGGLESGQFRVDVNVSVTGPKAPPESGPFGQRVEIKNLNSFAALAHAIEFEADRHIELIESGRRVIFETRSYDPGLKSTVGMRGKEAKGNYRFIREHDIPEMLVSPERIAKVVSESPPTIEQIRATLSDRFTEAQIDAMLEDSDLKDFVTKLADALPEINPTFIFNWVTVDLAAQVNRSTYSFSDMKMDTMLDFIQAVHDRRIVRNATRSLLEQWMRDPSQNLLHLASSNGLLIESTPEVDVAQLIKEQILKEPIKWEEVQQGSRSLDYFMGPLMKQLRGRIRPQELRSLLMSHLNN